jgi:hypothetical protein
LSENAIPSYVFRDRTHIPLRPIPATPVRSNKAVGFAEQKIFKEYSTSQQEKTVELSTVGTKNLPQQGTLQLNEGTRSLQQEHCGQELIHAGEPKSTPKTLPTGRISKNSSIENEELFSTAPSLSPIKGKEKMAQDWDWTTEW